MSPAEVPAATIATAGRLLADRLGLRLNPSLTGRLTRSVCEEAEANRLEPEAYAARLEADPALFQGLVDRISVQETSFFRDPGQLEGFRAHVLPGLRPPVRVWSAGCSNGQEPYTLAMLLADQGVADWHVTATDVSTRALERAEAGRYSDKEMEAVPPPQRARYFRPAQPGPGSEVVPELRSKVRVARHNLVTDPPPFEPGQVDVVFCRNVLIYLGHDAIVAFLERLVRWLRPPGWVFLGYSESLWQITDALELAKLGSGFAYRLRPDPPPTAAAGAVRRTQDRPIPAAPGSPRVAPTRRAAATAARPTAPAAQAPADLLAAGHDAMRAGDFASAVVAFRKYAYLEPDQAVAQLNLGLALEAVGDAAAARRAFTSARAMLRHGGASTETVEGYRAAEVARMLDAKLARE